jgi:hypothetical protein
MKRCFLIPKTDSSLTWLKEHVGSKDTVLPLSLEGLMICKKHFENVCSVEDFVPYPEIMKLAVRAQEVNQEFSRRSCAGATLEGYDWANICWHMQQWFFRDALLAEALALSLRSGGVEKIVWVGDPGLEPVPYLPTFGVVTIVMRFHLGDRFEMRRPPGRLAGRSIERIRKKVGFGLEQFYKRTLYREPDITPCRVLAVWSINEWDRYTDPMTELIREFGDQFQLWVLGARYPDRLKDWAKAVGLIPVTISFPDTIETDIDLFFKERWGHWVSKGRQSFANVICHPVFETDLLQYHFKAYFLKIWPSMAQWARKVERYLQIAKPTWLIGSSNYPPEWAFPHYVAKKLGIPSISLPHSYVQYGDGAVRSSYLACRNRLERANFKRSFPDDERILYCRNAGNSLSYPAQSGHLSDPSGERIVAFLTAHPDYGGSIMPTADRRVFLDSLRAFSTVPRDLKDLSFVIKSHPRGDVTPLLRNGVLLRPNVKVLDPSDSVIELIERSWVIVLGNHYGSVAVQAAMSGKPLIFLDSAKCFWPYTEKIAFAAGEVVEDVADFWNLMRKLKDSPPLYQELSERCQRFRTDYLQPATETLGGRIRSLESQQDSVLT